MQGRNRAWGNTAIPRSHFAQSLYSKSNGIVKDQINTVFSLGTMDHEFIKWNYLFTLFATLQTTHLFISASFKGEPGPAGPYGPAGAQGIGYPGPKVMYKINIGNMLMKTSMVIGLCCIQNSNTFL